MPDKLSGFGHVDYGVKEEAHTDYRPSGKLSGARLAIEGGVPVYQHLDGPQLEAEWMAFGSVQFSF